MTATVVAALTLHNQTCDRCQTGSPCLAAEQVQDEWLHYLVLASRSAELLTGERRLIGEHRES